MRARAEITGKYAGAYAKASKKDKGRMPARGLLGHGLEPGQRAPAPGGGGRAPAGPWEAGARGQGPQVLLTGALKILQRVWAAGGGVVAVSTSRSPCLPGGPAGGGAVRFDGEPRHEPGRQGRAGWP